MLVGNWYSCIDARYPVEEERIKCPLDTVADPGFNFGRGPPKKITSKP